MQTVRRIIIIFKTSSILSNCNFIFISFFFTGVQDVLFLVQKTDICQISLDSPDHSIIAVPLTGLAHAIAIDYDPIEGNIYWTDDEVITIAYFVTSQL